MFDYDIKQISQKPFAEYLKEKEKTCKKIQEKLAADGKKAEKITARQKELEDELRLIGQALEVYER